MAFEEPSPDALRASCRAARELREARHTLAWRGVPEGVPRRYSDQEWDRDAPFAARNLVTPQFAAQQLKVTPHAMTKTGGREHGPLLLWVFGGRGQFMRTYHELYVDMRPRPGPDPPHAWQGQP